ncbi:branched-chain amino acid ABC transporter permease [Aneurinibacillus sp. REN35]|uniref:branched-chain amino acid ABC transporter permease n=1 Tax=Aneurinibacillus sp. REN35 TaxID=3237286 RepID=UPI003529367A
MKKRIGLLICIAAAIGFPFVFSDNYLLHIMVISGINIVLVLSLNLIAGFTGQVSLGHAAFFGIGAYTSALLALNGVPTMFSFILAAIISAVFGLIIGYPVLRLRGHYFAIATLGFGEIIHLILNNWVDVTRGPMGLSGIPKPDHIGFVDFSLKIDYYYLTLILVLAVIYLSSRIKKSKMGRALLAIRTDEITASSMGINVAYYKTTAFVWSAAIAGMAGSAYAHYVLFLSPETFKLSMSINILLMLLIGGMGSIAGAILGGLFITVLSEYLRAFAEYQMLIYGVLIVIVVIFAPKGLSGMLERIKKVGKRERKELHESTYSSN